MNNTPLYSGSKRTGKKHTGVLTSGLTVPQIDPNAKRRIVANVCHTRSIIEPGNDITAGRNGLSIIFQRTIIYCPTVRCLNGIKVAPHTRCGRVEVINPACGFCRKHGSLFLAYMTVQ